MRTQTMYTLIGAALAIVSLVSTASADADHFRGGGQGAMAAQPAAAQTAAQAAQATAQADAAAARRNPLQAPGPRTGPVLHTLRGPRLP
jgi:hypothetical protein